MQGTTIKFKEKPMLKEPVDMYIQMQNLSDIEVGDHVIVVSKADQGDFGWPDVWGPPMDKYVATGVVGKVIDISKLGVLVDFDLDEDDESFFFPFFVLRVVKKNKKPSIKDLHDKLSHLSSSHDICSTYEEVIHKVADLLLEEVDHRIKEATDDC